MERSLASLPYPNIRFRELIDLPPHPSKADIKKYGHRNYYAHSDDRSAVEPVEIGETSEEKTVVGVEWEEPLTSVMRFPPSI